MKDHVLTAMPTTSSAVVGLINIAVHGHTYQPPRMDPFTGIIPEESGAHPYKNFNEKITAECYRPNAENGNFDRMSFDLGPTLASWLEKAHPDVYKRIIDADRYHHNAVAQAYNHVILPLQSRRNKKTQILWGMQDFLHRFGRPARGMWMAETAIDLETLDVMAQCGIAFTILAPWQVEGSPDFTEPYLVRLEEGRTITVFIYNDLSGAVSYNDDVTIDANSFATSYANAYINRGKVAAGIAQLTSIGTDMELYGHHKVDREKFLSHFLHHSASAYGLTVCSFEQFLAVHPATTDIAIKGPSSWSCWHGVDRWSGGCECDGTHSAEQRAWKPALRHAIEHLQEEGDIMFETYARRVLHDPWAVRDDYISLRNGWIAPEHFWERHAKTTLGGGTDTTSIHLVQHLLEAQYRLQEAFTSCGWFFEDLDRIEPKNNIAFARKAMSLMWLATGYDLQTDFLKDLAKAQSWRTGRTGADLYHCLPIIPVNLLPRVIA